MPPTTNTVCFTWQRVLYFLSPYLFPDLHSAQACLHQHARCTWSSPPPFSAVDYFIDRKIAIEQLNRYLRLLSYWKVNRNSSLGPLSVKPLAMFRMNCKDKMKVMSRLQRPRYLPSPFSVKLVAVCLKPAVISIRRHATSSHLKSPGF